MLYTQLLKKMLAVLPATWDVAHTWHNWSQHSYLRVAEHQLWQYSRGKKMFLLICHPPKTPGGCTSGGPHQKRCRGKLSISLIIGAALWTQTPFLCFTGARHNFQGPAKTEFIGNAQEVIKQPKGCDRSHKHTWVWGIFSDPWLFLEIHIAVCLENLPHTLVWLLFFSVPVCCHLLLLNRLTKTSWRPCEFWTHLFGNFHWCQMFPSTHVLMYHHLPQSTGSTARTVRFLLIAFEL